MMQVWCNFKLIIRVWLFSTKKKIINNLLINYWSSIGYADRNNQFNEIEFSFFFYYIISCLVHLKKNKEDYHEKV